MERAREREAARGALRQEEPPVLRFLEQVWAQPERQEAPSHDAPPLWNGRAARCVASAREDYASRRLQEAGLAAFEVPRLH